MNNGVYLDKPYANSLIVLGHNEGYIKSYTGGESSYEKNFFASYSKPDKANMALQYMVLYDKVYLHPYFDNFILDELINDGVFNIPDLGSAVQTDYDWNWSEIEKKGLAYPTISILNNSDFKIKMDELQNKIEQGLLKNYIDFIDEYYQAEAEILVGGKNPASTKRLNDIKHELGKRTPIFSALNTVLKVTNASIIANGPAIWDCSKLNTEKINNKNRTTEDIIVAGLYINGLNSIRIRSFSDALELRNHQAIHDFRNEFFEILNLFKKGEINEETIRKRINKANYILNLAKIADKTGSVATILGIPALAWNPAGIAMTMVGAVTFIGSYFAKHSFNWALLSNVQ